MAKRTRSARLRKYESVYTEYMRKKSPSPKVISRRICIETKEGEKDIEKKEKGERKKTSQRTLNAYQIFVKEESQKDKYRNMSGERRMRKIVEAWNKSKKRKK